MSKFDNRPSRDELISGLKLNPMQTLGYGDISQKAIDYIIELETKIESSLKRQRELRRELETIYIGNGGLADENTALRKQLAEREWQDIETAPRDGTHILYCIAGESWVNEGRYYEDGFYDYNEHPSDYGGGDKQYPTHWQPLPAIPEVK